MLVLVTIDFFYMDKKTEKFVQIHFYLKEEKLYRFGKT